MTDGQAELVQRSKCIASTIAGTRCTRWALDDRDHCRQHGGLAQPRTPTGLPDVTQQAIFDALKDGMSLENAITVAGASRTTVYDWLARAKEPGSSDAYRAFAAGIELARVQLKRATLKQLAAAARKGNVRAQIEILNRLERSDPDSSARRAPGQTEMPIAGSGRGKPAAEEDTGNVVQLRPASGDADW